MPVRVAQKSEAVNPLASSGGLSAVGVFLFFGAAMACLAGVTLVWPGTSLDRVWRFNPRAFQEMAPFGRAIGVPFLLLSAVLAAAGWGWFRRRLWGWGLAVVLIASQVLGNVVGIFRGRRLEGAVGFTIASALFLYLLSARVRAAFRLDKQTSGE